MQFNSVIWYRFNDYKNFIALILNINYNYTTIKGSTSTQKHKSGYYDLRCAILTIFQFAKWFPNVYIYNSSNSAYTSKYS